MFFYFIHFNYLSSSSLEQDDKAPWSLVALSNTWCLGHSGARVPVNSRCSPLVLLLPLDEAGSHCLAHAVWQSAGFRLRWEAICLLSFSFVADLIHVALGYLRAGRVEGARALEAQDQNFTASSKS